MEGAGVRERGIEVILVSSRWENGEREAIMIRGQE
jgi:hypothetical protein